MITKKEPKKVMNFRANAQTEIKVKKLAEYYDVSVTEVIRQILERNIDIEYKKII